MKIPSSNLERTCCVQELFMTFRTIFVHNMFFRCSTKRRASDKDLPVYSDLKLPLANQLPTKHFYLNFRKRKTETETKLKKQRKKLLSHHLRPGRVCLLKMSCLPMTTLRWKTWKHLDKVYFINEIIYRY